MSFTNLQPFQSPDGWDVVCGLPVDKQVLFLNELEELLELTKAPEFIQMQDLWFRFRAQKCNVRKKLDEW